MPRRNDPAPRHRHSRCEVREQRRRHIDKRLAEIRRFGRYSGASNLANIDSDSTSPHSGRWTRWRLHLRLARDQAEALGQRGPIYYLDVNMLAAIAAAGHEDLWSDGVLCRLDDRLQRWYYRCSCSWCSPQLEPGWRSRDNARWRRQLFCDGDLDATGDLGEEADE